MAVDILVVGGGGREHAILWKLKQSPRAGKLYCAPGNGGTAAIAENVAIDPEDVEALTRFVEEKNIGLTVVGPENPLGAGIVDHFNSKRLRIWGPTKAAARIESSKAFTKELMNEKNIPTASHRAFTDYEEALAYVREKGAPIVVKADGFAVGKGVVVCQTIAEAEGALKKMMVEKIFKESGATVVIEEFLEGPEITVQAFCDGTSYKLLPTTQDHKRVFDGDKGGNTGGMGAVGPLPWVTSDMLRDIEMSVIRPMLDALRERGTPYVGCLYAGLMITKDGPKVIEFNARFGDPECEVYMRLLRSDILDVFEASIEGRLADLDIEWNPGAACCVMIASRGYPETSEKGVPITGIEDANKMDEVTIFNMFTNHSGDTLVTNGGRVLGVSATGTSLKEALERAYEAIGKIHFDGMHFRRDIGAKSLGM